MGRKPDILSGFFGFDGHGVVMGFFGRIGIALADYRLIWYKGR